MNWVFKVMRLDKHKKNLKKVCLKKMQSNSNKEDLGWSGCASPSFPLLRCSWVACSQRQCCSPASQVGRGEKIESDWKRITSFSLQTEQCTGSPSWCSVQVLSQLLMSTTPLSSSQGNKAISYSHLLTESTDIAWKITMWLMSSYFGYFTNNHGSLFPFNQCFCSVIT